MSTVLVSGFSLNTQIVITVAVCALTVFTFLKCRQNLNRLSTSIILAFTALSATNIYQCYSFYQPINENQIRQLLEIVDKSIKHPKGLEFRNILTQYAEQNGMEQAKHNAQRINEIVLKAYIKKKEWKELFDLSERLGI